MRLKNELISIKVTEHGAELRSAVKNGREYMWNADKTYWARTSPVLFPFVGGLKEKKYVADGETYYMDQHGFARDCEFELLEVTEDSVAYVLKSDKETLGKYPYEFMLMIRYTLVESTIKVEWTVSNKDHKKMYFSIGAHPAFQLMSGDNYFQFDNHQDITYHLINENGLYLREEHQLKNDGYVKIETTMFDQDALIIEDGQAKVISLCDSEKKPYVTVRFNTPLFGLWSPAKKNAPFVCIEPWYGRCDSADFNGEIAERDYIMSLDPAESFTAEYEIELH